MYDSVFLVGLCCHNGFFFSFLKIYFISILKESIFLNLLSHVSIIYYL